ncbi:MliC family protein [Variovorax dokdonensis]|uniref:MliC family protein n=1 Tax=Variovorax dokdonensis TaxID=344883 RepID=A0ABT7N667_9BURK|nr:MliC family protein [Variovorax dokdonensis]MDM0043417.1 MliC family protein [Variovorax dokdonensis]
MNQAHRHATSPMPWRTMARAAAALTSLAALGACSTTAMTDAPPAPASTGAWGAPIRFVCDGTPPSTVVVRYSQPGAASMSLSRGDRVVQLERQRAASGARYASADVEFWEHQGEAQLRWGANAPSLRCVAQR